MTSPDSSSSVHTIRLAGPWQVMAEGGLQFQEGSQASPRRVKLPCSWNSLFGQQTGQARFVRTFNTPTGLDQQQLSICVTNCRLTGELFLNDERLGMLSAEEEISRHAIPFQLPNQNRLEIVLRADEPQKLESGLHEPVLLEIAEPDESR